MATKRFTKKILDLSLDDLAANVKKSIVQDDLTGLKNQLQHKSKVKRKTIVDHQVYTSTPLVQACEIGNLEIIQYLVENCGADVNQETIPVNKETEIPIKSTTPLRSACLAGNIGVLKFLITKGANVEQKVTGHDPVVIENIGNVAITRCLIANGANIYAKDAEGKIAFDHAMEKNVVGSVVVLLKHIEDANLKLKLTRPAIHFACVNRRLNLLDALVNNGGDVHTVCFNGCNYLMQYIECTEICEYFLRNGLNLDRADNYGKTVLHHAVKKRAVSSLELIARRYTGKVDPNAEDVDKRTPLHYAVEENDVTMIKLVLSMGADINICNNDGLNAIQIAVRKSDMDVVKCLQDHGADIKSAFLDGRGLIQTAALFGNETIVQYLVQKKKVTVASKIDAYELLAAKYMIDGMSKKAGKLYQQALTLRNKNNMARKQQSILNECFGNVQEPESANVISQSNINDSEAMLRLHEYGILIRSRIFGPFCSEVAGEVQDFYDKNQFSLEDEGTDITLFIVKANIMKFGEVNPSVLMASYKAMLSLYCTWFLLVKSNFDRTLKLVLCFIQNVENYCKEYNLKGPDDCEVVFTDAGSGEFLEMAIYILYRLLTTLEDSDTEQISLIQDAVKELINVHKKCMKMGFFLDESLLYMFFSVICANDYIIEGVVYSVIVMLINGGVPVDKVSKSGTSPLHLLLSTYLNKKYCLDWSDEDVMDKIIKLLLDKGTHVDSVNEKGKCLLDLLKEYGHPVCEVRDRTLQCLCSEVILGNNILFEEHVPKHMIPFIKLHGRKEMTKSSNK